MKLSEALEIGSKDKKQIFGSYKTPEGICALEAIYEAFYPNEINTSMRDLSKIIQDTKLDCPLCNSIDYYPTALVYHLNDYHKESFQNIISILKEHDL